MTDSFVQVATDGSGKKVNSQAITDFAGNASYRQTVTLGDPNVLSSVQAVDATGAAVVGFNRPQPVYLDDQNNNLDDNGNQIVSIDTSISDVATQSTQAQVLAAVQLALTDTQLRAAPLPVTMLNTLALTDAQLRASAIPTSLIQPDVSTTGTITTTDIVVGAPAGTGALLTGASTAGSFVFSAVTAGYTAWVVQITGLTTGTLYFEGSTDSTTGTDGNWINLIGRQIGILNSLVTGNATVNGNWRGNLSAYRFFRVRAVGTLTGTPAILIRMSAGLATVFLNGSIPTGQNTIGAVTGAFFQTTQPVSAAALPLPTGAPTENAGKLQGAMDLLEAILVELRVISVGIAQLGQATPDAPDLLRSELSNFIQ